jgi:chromosomal replication initiator protein
VAEAPGQSYNPLFIYGAAGLGKTHLLHAIGHYLHEHHPAKRVRYVPCETLLGDFVDAIRTKAPTSFKHRYQENDVLLLDDIQFMQNKEGLQEELCHIFNDGHNAGRQIVLVSDRPPRDTATLEDRMRTRFERNLITDIQPLDVETRLAIARRKAEREPVHFPDEVIELVATYVSDNICQLEGSIIRLSAYAALTDSPVTVNLALNVLRDVLDRRQCRIVTAELIIETVAKQYGFEVEKLRGRGGARPVVAARHIAMWMCRQTTDLSYRDIAQAFGGRDHAAVIRAVGKVGRLLAKRQGLRDQITRLLMDLCGEA